MRLLFSRSNNVNGNGNLNRALAITIVAILILFNARLLSADELTDIVKNLQQNMQNSSKSEKSKTHIPGFDPVKIEQEKNRLDSIPASALEAEGTNLQRKSEECLEDEKCYLDKSKASIVGAGITSKTSSIPPLNGYEDLIMFKRADLIFSDPLSVFKDLSEESCKESINNVNPGFKKTETTTTKKDVIEEKVQCEKPKNILKCEKSLIVNCANMQECDMGGIEPGSVASDMIFQFSSGVLLIGTVRDNYWGGGPGTCEIHDKVTTFKIKNKEEIREFNLFEVGFDDYIQIHLNGHQLFIGPDGGNKLELVQKRVKDFFWTHIVTQVDYGTGIGDCERSTDWVRHPNIDLKAFLKEGENVIKTRTVVGNKGESWLKIRAKQNCCSKWKEDEWSKRCWVE